MDLDSEDSPAAPGESRCDFLFFSAPVQSDVLYFAPVELKRGSPNAREVGRQLQAGSDIGDHLLPTPATIRFRPVVGYGGELRKVQRRRFREQGIQFRGRTAIPQLLRCGDSLASDGCMRTTGYDPA